MGECKVCLNTRLVVEHWQGQIVWQDELQTITFASTIYKSCPACCAFSFGDAVTIPSEPTIPL